MARSVLRAALSLVVLSLASPVAGLAQFTDVPPAAAYVLQGVTVTRADGSRLEGVTIVIRDGVIESMGSDVAVPPDAEVLAGDSLMVYPGLVDGDLGASYEMPEPPEADSVATWNPDRSRQSFTPHLLVADHITATSDDLTEHRKAGVVAGAVIPEGRLMPGQAAALVLRPEAETSEEITVYPSTAVTMTLRGADGVYPATLFGVMAFYRQTFADAQRHQAIAAAFEADRGAGGATAPPRDEDLKVVADLLEGRTRAFFRADSDHDILRVLGLAEAYGFQVVIVGGDEAWKVADELAAGSVPVLVSLDFPERQRWKPEPDSAAADSTAGGDSAMPPDTTLDAGAEREKRRLEEIYANPGRLAAAGVSFALTSGGGEAKLLEGARKAIEYGLSEGTALAALTATPASLLGLEYLARIEEGNTASLVITDGPLFQEGTAIRYTFVEGWLERGEQPDEDQSTDEEDER